MHSALSRRRFLGSVAVAGTLGVRPAVTKPAQRRKGKYIDIHTHIGTFYWGKELTADGLIRQQ
jgi:hypothetical protein